MSWRRCPCWMAPAPNSYRATHKYTRGSDRSCKKKKRKRKKRRRKIIIKYNKHSSSSSSTTATYMKGRDATNGKSLDGVESLHRLVKLNQWIVDLKLLPRRSCSFPNATPWGWQNEVSRLGVGRRNGRSLGTHKHFYIFFSLWFLFFFSFFFSCEGFALL